MKVRRFARTTLGNVAVRTGRSWGMHRYPYMMLPADLRELMDAVEQTSDLGGSAVEVGCAAGATTVFLDRHMRQLNDPRRYHCIDTFAGFVPADVAVERRRGKSEDYSEAFTMNDRRWFEATMRINNVDRVVVHEADANVFDFSSLGPLSFCLADVDLYRPTYTVLERVWEAMVPGGLILVDDCKPDGPWDGALQAYTEFVESRELAVDIRNGMLGVIRR